MNLADPRLTSDPRRLAPEALGDLERAAVLAAEAATDVATAKLELQAFTSTLATALSAKYTKWPKWRVDAAVEADPKFRYHTIELIKAEEVARVADARLFGAKQRVVLLGQLYALHVNQ